MIITQAVYFTIDGVPSDTPAWNVENIDELLKPAKRRGPSGVAIVNAHGRLAQSMWRDSATRVMSWTINCHQDWDGNPYTDAHEGVEANLQYLLDNVYAVPDNDDSTRELVLHPPSGITRTGTVQVRDFDWTTAGPNLLAVVEFYLCEGELREVGS